MRKQIIPLLVLAASTLGFSAQLNIRVGTATRSLLYHAPAGLTDNRPLVISLHGMNQDAAFQQNQSKWEVLADTAKFVVVYPSGTSLRWDISGNSDIDFIVALIDTMYNRFRIDKNRVYLNGFSMGGMMTYHAANRIADKIAAFGPVSGYPIGGGAASSSRPIPIIHVHGDADDVVTYNNVGSYLGNWRTRNQCPATAQVTRPYPANKPGSSATQNYWAPCAEGTEVMLLTLGGKGHWWSNDGAGVHTSDEIWNFSKKFSLGGSVSSSSSALSSSSSVPPEPRAPYNDVIAGIPGTIQAENYDRGGQSVAYNDSDPENLGDVYRNDGVDITGSAEDGFKIGWTAAGEWLEYTVQVDSAGEYLWEARVSAGGDGSAFRLQLDGVDLTGVVSVPNTGSWDEYTLLTGTTPRLSAGQKVLRLSVEGAYFNMDWMRFANEVPVGTLPLMRTRVDLLPLKHFDLTGRRITPRATGK